LAIQKQIPRLITRIVTKDRKIDLEIRARTKTPQDKATKLIIKIKSTLNLGVRDLSRLNLPTKTKSRRATLRNQKLNLKLLREKTRPNPKNLIGVVNKAQKLESSYLNSSLRKNKISKQICF
jgi:hypothetical protein